MAIVNSSQTAQIDRHLGEDGWYVITPGEIGKIRTSAADTNGAYTMLEVVAQPLNGVPVHIHTNEDEHFVILEGTAHFAKGDVKLDAPAGSTVSIRKGVPHAWCNGCACAHVDHLLPRARRGHVPCDHGGSTTRRVGRTYRDFRHRHHRPANA